MSVVIAQHRPFELFLFYCKQFLHVGFVLDWLVTCNKCHVARVLINQNKLSATEQPVNSKPETNYGSILIGNFELLFRLWKWLLLFVVVIVILLQLQF